MSEKLTTWFLLEGPPPGDPVLRVLKHLGALDQLDHPWPRTAIRLDGGTVRLICEDFPQLQTKLDGCETLAGSGEKGVEALFLGDLQILEKLHEKRFKFRGSVYQVIWQGAKPWPERHPYEHRFIHLVYRGVAAPDANSRHSPAEVVPINGRLLFAPVKAAISTHQAEALAFEAKGLDAVALPPYREGETPGYFETGLMEARLTLSEVINNSPLDFEGTTLSALWHATDAPLVRPALLDGGYFQLDSAADSRTAIGLRFVSSDLNPDAIAKYRADFFTADHSPETPMWARDIRRWLIEDIKNLAKAAPVRGGAGVSCSIGNRRCDWGPHDLPKYKERDPGKAWGEIDRVLGLLENTRGKWITEDLFPRILKISQGKPNDDDLAVMAFMRDLFRCPWNPSISRRMEAESGPDWDWRYAILDAVLSVQEVRPWKVSEEFSSSEAEILYPRVRRKELLHWRLLAPLGMRFLDNLKSELGCEGSMMLNDTFRLN
jgi:hypothetical protein